MACITDIMFVIRINLFPELFLVFCVLSSGTSPSSAFDSTRIHSINIPCEERFHWWAIHPLSRLFRIDVSYIESSTYCSVSHRFFSCTYFVFRDRRWQIYRWEDPLHTAAHRVWSETVCDERQGVATVRKHRQDYLKQKVQLYLTGSPWFSYTTYCFPE